MSYFWDTVETVPEGVGFSHYDGVHVTWIAALITVCMAGSLLYRRLGQGGRRNMRGSIAALLLLDEVWKLIGLISFGNYLADYLPLHLCSVNIFLIAWHCVRPGKGLDNFLYTVCIPGALAAMLFPTWTALPPANFMHLHSFTVHILLVLYPVALTAGGDIKPDIRELPKSLGILVVLAAIAWVINTVLGTNFFFLDHADPGNPLYLFEQAFGSHLLGFPVIILGVLLVMHAPWLLYRRMRKAKV